MLRKLGRYLWNDFKKSMKSERGTWAGIAGVVGAGVSMATQKKGKAGQQGFDVYTPNAVGEQTGIGKENVQYLGGMRQALEAGNPWANYGTFEQQMRKKQQRMQQEAMYGNQGDRYGAYQTGMESGSLLGLGGGATQRSLRPLMTQYLQGGQQIEDMLAQAKAGAMQNKEQMYLQGMNQMAQPFGGQAVPYNIPGTPLQASPWASLAGSVMGGIAAGRSQQSGVPWGAQNVIGGANQGMPGTYGYTTNIPGGGGVGSQMDLGSLSFGGTSYNQNLATEPPMQLGQYHY